MLLLLLLFAFSSQASEYSKKEKIKIKNGNARLILGKKFDDLCKDTKTCDEVKEIINQTLRHREGWPFGKLEEKDGKMQLVTQYELYHGLVKCPKTESLSYCSTVMNSMTSLIDRCNNTKGSQDTTCKALQEIQNAIQKSKTSYKTELKRKELEKPNILPLDDVCCFIEADDDWLDDEY